MTRSEVADELAALADDDDPTGQIRDALAMLDRLPASAFDTDSRIAVHCDDAGHLQLTWTRPSGSLRLTTRGGTMIELCLLGARPIRLAPILGYAHPDGWLSWPLSTGLERFPAILAAAFAAHHA